MQLTKSTPATPKPNGTDLVAPKQPETLQSTPCPDVPPTKRGWLARLERGQTKSARAIIADFKRLQRYNATIAATINDEAALDTTCVGSRLMRNILRASETYARLGRNLRLCHYATRKLGRAVPPLGQMMSDADSVYLASSFLPQDFRPSSVRDPELLFGGSLTVLPDRLSQRSKELRNIAERLRWVRSRSDLLSVGTSALSNGDRDEAAKGVATGYMVVLAVIYLFGESIMKWSKNSEADEGPRRDLSGDCALILPLFDQTIANMIVALQDGPTLDGDEAAILNALRCLEAHAPSRVASVVSKVRGGAAGLLYDVDGDEWDELLQILKRCNIINFDVFDDDAARLFVSSNPDSILAALSLDDIRTLVLAMFAGSCGDDDEEGILRLLFVQNHCKVRQLFSMPNMSLDDFRDNIDGSEWGEPGEEGSFVWWYVKYVVPAVC